MARPGLDKHRKFRRLLRLLGEPRPHVRGYLESLWEVAYENGDPVIGDPHMIEASAEYPGEPGKLFAALRDCGGEGSVGFIEQAETTGTWMVHDLFDHAPEYVKKRQKREHERKSKGIEHSGGQRRTTADNGAPPAPAPAPAPAPVDSSNEESFCSTVARRPVEQPKARNDPLAAKVSPDASAAVRVDYPNFPTIPGKTGKDTHWSLTSEQVSKWVETFPAVNVEAECKRAHAWVMANLDRRKTARGMPDFLFKWLSKEQDKGPSRGDRPSGKSQYTPNRGQKFVG